MPGCLQETVNSSAFVARKLARFDLIGSMIGEATFDHTLSLEARLCELEVLEAQIKHNLKVLRKSRKRKKGHDLRLDP